MKQHDVSDHSSLESDILFEGDLLISREMIEWYYDLPGGRVSKRAALRYSALKLWPNCTVPYYIDPRMHKRRRKLVSKAIAHWQNKTCLHFVSAFVGSQQVHNHYINFTDAFNGCYSNSIGKKRKGGKQVINLGRGCGTLGITVHEIGHAIGFFHEQSRPDRDKYVEILWKNIRKRNYHNFQRRRRRRVDSRGIGYDYASIMHYSLDDFSKNGKPTIKITNQAEFMAQGKPRVGFAKYLSEGDILQTRRMYNCTCSG